MEIKFSWFTSSVFVFTLILLGSSACNPDEAPVEQISAKQTPTEQLAIEPTLTVQPLVKPTSVQRIPIDCAQIQENDLSSLEFNQLQAESMQQWLERDSPFQGVEIFVSPSFDKGVGALIWEQDGIQYHAEFHEDVLGSISKSWQNSNLRPTADEVLACLGKPELYGTAHTGDPEGYYIGLTLWYLKKGIVVWSAADQLREDKNKPVVINGKVVMHAMTFVAPGTAEEMVRSTYTAGELDDFRTEFLETLKPWPSSWEKIEISSARF